MMAAQLTFQALNWSWSELWVPMIASLAASVAVYWMYHLFYGLRTIGAGVDRAFILGGPAITALFLGIQSSIPLSLGLLGALSFVRFRTPVKDSAEIGFLLLLIASSIGIATGTYAIVAVLFVLTFLSLSVQTVLQRRFSLRRFSHLLLSMEKDAFERLRQPLEQFIREQVDHLNLKTLSVMDGKVSLQYQFRKRPQFDRSAFVCRLSEIAAPAQLEIFLGGS